MPDDDQLDQHLHRFARESLDRRAANVDVDTELGSLHARLAGQPTVAPHSARYDRTRWFVAAAAAVLVVAGIAALAWLRDRDGTTVVAPPPDTSATSPTSAASSSAATDGTGTTAPASTTPPQPVAATATPRAVAPGEVLTITPAAMIQRMCLDIVTLTRVDGDGDAAGTGGQIVDGAWRAAPGDDVTAVTYPDCQGTTSDSPVSLVIPADVPAGDYETCLTEPGNPAGCATVTVTGATPTGTSVPSPGQAELDVGYFGRRHTDAQPYFQIDQFSADGTDVGTLADAEVAQLFPRHALVDGSTLALDGVAPDGRCINQPLTRNAGGSPAPLHPDLTEARSIGVTANGVVLAGRDVCPTGTRWGDPGTHWELVALDLAAANPSIEILETRQPEPALILFENKDFVVAVGEPTIDGVSPDGRYVVLREAYNSEQWRWHVLDLEAPAEMLAIDSTCELAGDIVGPPRFVGGGIMVVARLCAPLQVADAPTNQQGIGSGDVQVEAIDLAAVTPSEQIVWHASVPGLGAHNYTRTVGLSARRDAGGTVWALLSAGGDVEVPTRTFALHGIDATEITRTGYETFAFDPAQLLTPWDEPPA